MRLTFDHKDDRKPVLPAFGHENPRIATKVPVFIGFLWHIDCDSSGSGAVFNVTRRDLCCRKRRIDTLQAGQGREQCVEMLFENS